MNKNIQISNNPIIPFIEGDGIGSDITPAVQKIVNCAVEQIYGTSRKIQWKEVLAGEKAFNLTGEWLPEATIEALKKYKIGIKGPLTTQVGKGIRSLNVALRQTLDLYVCLRPVRWFKGVPSPFKYPERVNMIIFRENTEDIYAGIEWEAESPEAKKMYDFLCSIGVNKVRFPETSAFGVKPVSKQGSKRLIEAAIQYAISNSLPSITLVHKGNIMKFTEGGFKEWGYELASEKYSDTLFTMKEYSQIKLSQGKEPANFALENAKNQNKIILKDCIADAFLQETLLRPQDHSVIATLNLNGDYISDQLAAMVGGIGIAPGGNINYEHGYAIFEATHGTAPDIVGTGKANPASLLLSAVMMLDFMEWKPVAKLIEQALENTYSQAFFTSDLSSQTINATTLTTNEFSDKIIDNLKYVKL